MTSRWSRFSRVYLLHNTSSGNVELTSCLDVDSGYGYQVRFVEDLENIDQDVAASLEWAVREIKSIQAAARSGKPVVKPRWPVLIMRTPKVRSFLLLS